jgi:hypothetical protein
VTRREVVVAVGDIWGGGGGPTQDVVGAPTAAEGPRSKIILLGETEEYFWESGGRF